MWPKGSSNLDDNSSALMIEAVEIYTEFEFNVSCAIIASCSLIFQPLKY